MTVYVWTDRREPAVPRALIQRGECSRGHCRQFALSISNGAFGLTVRFESETEFQQFLAQGEVAGVESGPPSHAVSITPSQSPERGSNS
jgi:hypothetical protein